MQNVWIGLVLIAQLAWAISIYFDKYLLSSQTNEETSESPVGTMLLVSAFFNFVVGGLIFGVMVLRFGEGTAGAMLVLDQPGFLKALFVGVLEVVWLIPYFYALNYTDETMGPPVLQTIPIFGLVLGYFVFNEVPTGAHIFAGIVVLIGALVLNLELVNEEREERGTLKVHWKGIALMLLASFIVSLTGFVFKDSAIDESYWGTAFWTAMGGGFTGILIWALVPRYRKQFNVFVREGKRKMLGLNLLNEVIDNAAIYVYYAAIVFGPSTALVQSTIAYQPALLLLIALVLGKFGSVVHKKALSNGGLLRRTIGITTVVVGAVMIFH